MNERLVFISRVSVRRNCSEANEGKTWLCGSKVWEENWTLVAQNPLGTVRLTDSAQLADRGTTFSIRSPFNREYLHYKQSPSDCVLIFSRVRTHGVVSLPVHLLAPANVLAVEVEAWNATLKWSWPVEAYKKLEMLCQLKLIGHELSSTVSSLLRFQLPESCLLFVWSWELKPKMSILASFTQEKNTAFMSRC